MYSLIKTTESIYRDFKRFGTDGTRECSLIRKLA
jgi:hypothetical protein